MAKRIEITVCIERPRFAGIEEGSWTVYAAGTDRGWTQTGTNLDELVAAVVRGELCRRAVDALGIEEKP